jgi:propanol-preferring alcohol dehydrogenase
LGADILVNAQAGDPAAAVRTHTGGGAHGVLITAPSRVAFEQGVSMARKRGTCVMVGKPPGEFPLPLREVVSNCISVRGALIGTRHDMTEALTLAAEGKVKPDVERQPLTAINYVLGRLEGGVAPPLMVLDFDAAVSQA